MFYLINSGKTCLFLSLVGFLKNTNRQKGGLQPRCCIMPILWGAYPPRAKNSLRNEFSWQWKNGTKRIKELKDSLQDLHEVPEHLWSARKRRRSALCDALLDKEAPSGRIEGLKGASTFQSFNSTF